MGFEIKFFYYDSNETGYNLTTKKEFTKNLGTEVDEIELFDVANLITKQLARRDLLITDFEIYEFIKKKVNCKQIKNGISIKSKKFILDEDLKITVQDESPSTSLVPAQVTVPVVPVNPNRRPIKWITLDTDLPTLQKIKGSGLAFTPEKRYPVFSETPHPKQLGVMFYATMDDNNREITVMDTYFLAADQRLQRGFDTKLGKDDSPGEIKLMYDGTYDKDVPDIRAKR